MTCKDALSLLSPYHDRELDPVRAREVDRHLLECDSCRAELARIREMSDAMHAYAPTFSARASLRANVEDIGSPRAAGTRWWLTFSLGTACGLAAALLVVFLQGLNGGSALATALVDDHVRSLMANHLMDVPSSDRHTVKPWFLGKVDFSPTVIDLASEGFPLLGGRLDYLNGRTAAVLVYGRAKHRINVFVQPGPAAPSLPSNLHGYHLVQWRIADLNYWAVSDVASDDLKRFEELFERHA